MKSFIDIYVRNAKGVLKRFPDIDLWTYGWPFVAVIYTVLLPVTTIFGALIKSFIDFFSRKELPETRLKEVDEQINALNEDRLKPLINKISSYENAQSKSSQELIQNLHNISDRRKDIATEKRALQEKQLDLHINPGRLAMYKESYIANSPLNKENQKTLDGYISKNREYSQSQQLEDKKIAIKNYLLAPHNSGKRMQHIICNHFFPPAPTSEVGLPETDQITPLSRS